MPRVTYVSKVPKVPKLILTYAPQMAIASTKKVNLIDLSQVDISTSTYFVSPSILNFTNGPLYFSIPVQTGRVVSQRLPVASLVKTEESVS